MTEYNCLRCTREREAREAGKSRIGVSTIEAKRERNAHVFHILHEYKYRPLMALRAVKKFLEED